MINIRTLLEPQLGAIHASKLTATQYRELATRIEGEIAYVVANCKLDPQADAMLHLVIAEIGSGVDAMTGKAASVRPADGAATVVTALDITAATSTTRPGSRSGAGADRRMGSGAP